MAFRVVMTLDGTEVPSSCVFTGTQRQCDAVAGRLLRQRDRHSSAGWVVLPCLL